MDLISADAYWRLQNGLIASYPTLRASIDCEAIVVGGGISGALLLDKLTRAGISAVLLERYDVGAGSTSGSTGLLQYEIDVELHELIEKLGREKAERAYWSCHEAIDALEMVSTELNLGQAFQRKSSLYLASTEHDRPKLQTEFRARKAAGFDVSYMEAKEIESKFSFSRPGGILSRQAAEIDPYIFTHRLIDRAQKNGARVFDRTCVESFECRKSDVSVITDQGVTVRARSLIFATGYEAVKYLPKGVVRLHSSFALASKPIDDFTGWPGCCLIWETARPYSYVRTTRDNRIVMGGEDEMFQNPKWRDEVLPEKAQILWEKLGELFPQLQLEFGYNWAGTFGETKDGLPYIGSIEKYPGVYFSCGYGGNGITYSSIAADIIVGSLQSKPHRDEALFSFDRVGGV